MIVPAKVVMVKSVVVHVEYDFGIYRKRTVELIFSYPEYLTAEMIISSILAKHEYGFEGVFEILSSKFIGETDDPTNRYYRLLSHKHVSDRSVPEKLKAYIDDFKKKAPYPTKELQDLHDWCVRYWEDEYQSLGLVED